MRTNLNSIGLRSAFLAVVTAVVGLGLAPESASSAAPRIAAERVTGGFSVPLFAGSPPGDTSRLFIVQKTGEIFIVNLPAGTVNPTPFLDIHDRLILQGNEQGLLGLAFDPDYATNGRFYVNYTAPGGAFRQGVTHVSRFNLTDDPDIADPDSEVIVLAFDQPQANHNGGWIGFSPRPDDDHNLYIATGDGGAANDQGPGHIEPGGNAQSTQTLLGKMLRIHIEDSGTYTIPPNNPFAGSPTDKQEIFCFGLRNPFRCSFDRQTGNLWIGDVGSSRSRHRLDSLGEDQAPRPERSAAVETLLRSSSVFPADVVFVAGAGFPFGASAVKITWVGLPFNFGRLGSESGMILTSAPIWIWA